MKSRPIIIIDDDKDDVDFIKIAMQSLKVQNPLLSFENPLEAIDFLKKSDKSPFIILCDVNMPFINGFEFRRMIESDNNLKLKSIPFLFLSTAADKPNIEKAYGLCIQGYFRKPVTQAEMIRMLKDIISYWEKSYHPNSASVNN